MKNATILLWRYHAGPSWLLNLVGEEICRVTKSPYVHAAIFLGGKVYESTVWFVNGWPHGGVRIHEEADWDEAWEPITDVPPDVVNRMIAYAEEQISEHRPYNVFELLAMSFVWPTRRFWRWLGWIPFTAGFLGKFCSTFTEKVWLAGYSLVPLDDEEMAPPCELAQSPMLRKVT